MLKVAHYRFGTNERLEFYVKEKEPGKREKTSDRVIGFLRDYLANDPRCRDDVFRAADKAGLTRDNLYDYRDEAGVGIKRGEGNDTLWFLKE